MESHTWKTLTDTDDPDVKSRITIQNDNWVYEKGFFKKRKKGKVQTGKQKTNQHQTAHLFRASLKAVRTAITNK